MAPPPPSPPSAWPSPPRAPPRSTPPPRPSPSRSPSGYAEIHSDLGFKPGYILGSIDHAGSGFTLTAGSTKVELSDFVVDPGNSILYGTVGGTPKVPLLDLDGTNVKVGIEGGNVVLDGTVAKLTDTAAGALNKAFKVDAIKAGTPLGVVHLVAKGESTTYDAAADKTTAISRLTGKSTSVTLDAGTAKALGSLGVAVDPGRFGHLRRRHRRPCPSRSPAVSPPSTPT